MFILPFTYRNPNLATCYLTLLQALKGNRESLMTAEVVLKGGKEAVKDDEEALKGDGMTTGSLQTRGNGQALKGD